MILQIEQRATTFLTPTTLGEAPFSLLPPFHYHS
jgi:hypothetical protein